MLTSATRDQTLKIWDLRIGDDEAASKLAQHGHNDKAYLITFSGDFRRLLRLSRDGYIKAWDTTAGICTSTVLIGGILIGDMLQEDRPIAHLFATGR
jgi:WD40 repeat protein